VLEKREINIKKAREEYKEGMLVVVAGILQEVRPIITKRNEQMAFLKLADLTSSVEVVAFPRLYQEHRALLSPEQCIALRGRVSHRNGEFSLVAEQVKALT
jgi:DNA polymerase-3 subunit alpha